MTVSLQNHKPDLRDRILGASRHQKIALHYGLKITEQPGGLYRVEGAGRDFRVADFKPDFIDTRASGGDFSKRQLLEFMGFLHQPLRAGIEKSFTDKPSRAAREQQLAERKALHRMLRFAAAGSVEIPLELNEDLEKETAECHAKTEQAMRDADAWNGNIELGNNKPTQSSVPGTGYAARGFAFQLDPGFVNKSAHKSTAQAALREQFWAMIDQATGGRYTQQRLDFIHLSGMELEKLCAEFHQSASAAGPRNPLTLIDRVAFEEAVQERLQDVEARVRALSISPEFHRQLERAEQGYDPTEKLRGLMECSTALTPIVDSQMMRDIWTRYHFTERYESPLPDLMKDYGVMLAIFDLYARQTAAVAPAQMEALAQEFYPLLAFSQQFADRIRKGHKQPHPFKAKLAEMSDQFHAASLLGVSLSPEMMPESYRDVLETLDTFLGSGQSLPLATASAGINTTVNFTLDIVNFLREWPKIAALVAAGGLGLYLMKEMNKAPQPANNIVMTFGDTGLEQTAINPNSIPEDARTVQNWHYDMGLFGLYKHYMYSNAVVGPVKTGLDWLRMGTHWTYNALNVPINVEPEFSKSAEKLVEPVADKLFWANILQNFSHVAFWCYMGMKGYLYRFKGARKMFDLMSPVTDLGYRMGVSGAEFLHLKRRTRLADCLMNPGMLDFDRYKGDVRIFNPAAQPGCKRKGASNEGCIFTQIAKAAEQRVAVEDSLPEAVKDAQITLQRGGLKETFEISAKNLGPALSALESFDMTMTQIAAQAGLDPPWYQAYLLEKTRLVTDALKAYRRDGDVERLQSTLDEHLHALAGAQIRSSELSPIYQALLGKEPSEKLANHLTREADAEFGRLKRAAWMAEKRKKFTAPLSKAQNAKTRALMGGMALWDATVASARLISKSVRKVTNKYTVIAITAIATASVALDMAGAGNSVTNSISAITGGTVSASITGVAFAIYNFWEDVLGVHVGTGAGLLTLGALAGYAHRGLQRKRPTGVRPLHSLPQAQDISPKTPPLVKVPLTISSQTVKKSCARCPLAELTISAPTLG